MNQQANKQQPDVQTTELQFPFAKSIQFQSESNKWSYPISIELASSSKQQASKKEGVPLADSARTLFLDQQCLEFLHVIGACIIKCIADGLI